MNSKTPPGSLFLLTEVVYFYQVYKNNKRFITDKIPIKKIFPKGTVVMLIKYIQSGYTKIPILLIKDKLYKPKYGFGVEYCSKKLA